MAKQPDINVFEDKSSREVVFEVNGESHRVTAFQFQECCRALKIKNTQGIFSSFRLICEWFIKEEQYVELEEIK